MKLFFLVLFISCNLVASESAIVKFINGDVDLVLDSKVKKLYIGYEIDNGKIKTHKDSSSTIVFSDTSVLVLGPLSEVELKSYQYNLKKKLYSLELFLKKGSIVFETGEISKLSPQSISIETRQGKISISEGKFAIKAD